MGDARHRGTSKRPPDTVAERTGVNPVRIETMTMNLRRLKLRARALLTRRRVERDLDQEHAFHIERETQKHIAGGVDPAEARTRVMARFGSVTVAADACRDERGTALIDGVIRDILYACRSFR